MNIQKKLIKFNFKKGNNLKKYIVLHDSANYAPTAGALQHYKYFNGGDRNASAHYFIDSENIIQLVEDSDISFHCGDGKGKYGILNSTSIGIEICMNHKNLEELEQAYKLTIELVVHLMKKYDIPLENVVRHYDASRKMCPFHLSKDNWKAWNTFKNRIETVFNTPVKPVVKEVPATKTEVKQTGKFVIIAGTFSTKENADKQMEILKQKGIDCYVRKE
jgi:N-acetylmuramoyl-L-alanine amidase